MTVASSADSLLEPGFKQRSMGDSFGIASWVAVVGVIMAWIYVKQEVEVPNVEPISKSAVLSAPFQGNSQDLGLADRGDAAFAVGDIVSPAKDNALYYYQQALAADPGNARAQRGLEQVVTLLINEAETAIFRSDWDLARDNAARVLAIRPNDANAQDINRRAARLQRVQELIAEAIDLYAAGRLTLPEGNNAAAKYQAALQLDPDNEIAQQGLHSVVQRMVANAESAMYAGKMEKANAYLNRARAIDPNAGELEVLTKTSESWSAAEQNLQANNDLLAAAEALEEDRLMPPAAPNAFTLYQKVLQAEPESEAALRGLQFVREALLEKARTMLAAQDTITARLHIDNAERAGASADAVESLRDDVAYQERLLDAAMGRFERLYPITKVKPIRQTAPSFPRSAPEGATGEVNLQFTITQTGDVRDVEVVSAAASYFERAATRAVAKWRFEPVMENDRPVPVRVAVKLVFN